MAIPGRSSEFRAIIRPPYTLHKLELSALLRNICVLARGVELFGSRLYRWTYELGTGSNRIMFWLGEQLAKK